MGPYQRVATSRNPVILQDRDDILMRSYSVRRAGLSTVQISVLPGFFCLTHARNGICKTRPFQEFLRHVFGARFSIEK